jgi:hypothetical protein
VTLSALRIFIQFTKPPTGASRDNKPRGWLHVYTNTIHPRREQTVNHPDKKLLVVRASDIDITPPKYPRVVKFEGALWLEAAKDRDYKVPDHPIKVLGLLHHLAGKTWADCGFFFYAIQRIASAKGWKIHPFQGGPTE